MTRAARLGVSAMAAFFVFGACASGVSALTLLWPGGPLDALWQANPIGHARLLQAGGWGVLLMAAVCVVCALTARGLWRRRRWGHRLALGMLSVNLLGDVANAVWRDDPRTLIGIPIAGALIVFLLTPAVRRGFSGR